MHGQGSVCALSSSGSLVVVAAVAVVIVYIDVDMTDLVSNVLKIK